MRRASQKAHARGDFRRRELGARHSLRDLPQDAGCSRGAAHYRAARCGQLALGSLPAIVSRFVYSSIPRISARGRRWRASPAATVVLDPFHVFRGGGSGNQCPLRGAGCGRAFHRRSFASTRYSTRADRVWPGDGQLIPAVTSICSTKSDSGLVVAELSAKNSETRSARSRALVSKKFARGRG